MAKKASARKTVRKRATAKKTATRKSASRPRSKGRKTARPAAKRGTAKKKASPKKRTAPKPTRTARRKSASRAAASRTSRTNPTPDAPPSKLAAAGTAVRGAFAGAVAVVADKLPWGSTDKTDAIAMLEADHRRFEELLKQGEDTTERARKGRKELLQTLTKELNAHELIEEQVLYPALKKYPQAKAIVLEGYQEHHVADLIVKELHEVATNDEQWGAKFKVLKENIEHHIDEEEGEMFRTARAVLSHDDLHALGERMQQLRAEAGRRQR